MRHEKPNPTSLHQTQADSYSPEELAELIKYARLANSWLAKNGPATITSTADLVNAKDRAVNAERTRAANYARQTGTADPYASGKVPGHVPDTAVSGLADPPCGFLPITSRVNSKAGGYLGSRIGTVITHFTVDGVIP
jgi:hypothetical protein